jgi:hypothetical protein
MSSPGSERRCGGRYGEPLTALPAELRARGAVAGSAAGEPEGRRLAQSTIGSRLLRTAAPPNSLPTSAGPLRRSIPPSTARIRRGQRLVGWSHNSARHDVASATARNPKPHRYMSLCLPGCESRAASSHIRARSTYRRAERASLHRPLRWAARSPSLRRNRSAVLPRIAPLAGSIRRSARPPGWRRTNRRGRAVKTGRGGSSRTGCGSGLTWGGTSHFYCVRRTYSEGQPRRHAREIACLCSSPCRSCTDRYFRTRRTTPGADPQRRGRLSHGRI